MNTEMQQNQMEVAKYNLERRLKGSANWFYWIAGLSLVNWIISTFNLGGVFVLGLGVTQLLDGIARSLITELGSDYATVLTVISFVATLALSGLYAIFGYFGGKRANWAFFIGIAFYILDALLFVWVQDWMPIIFHGLALVYLFRGPGAIKQLQALDEATSTFVPNTQPF